MHFRGWKADEVPGAMIITRRMRKAGRLHMRRRFLIVTLPAQVTALSLEYVSRELARLKNTDVVFLPHGYETKVSEP